jgi:plasmid maintenance system antidote protein VapI
VGGCSAKRITRRLAQQSNREGDNMSNAYQHPGIILASVLRARSISPFALAESTHLSFETVSDMLEGKQDIGSIDSTFIEAYLGGNKPERWSDHQEIHNAWKKQQILKQKKKSRHPMKDDRAVYIYCAAAHLLRPFPAEEMVAREAHRDVGNVKNNHPELLNSA